MGVGWIWPTGYSLLTLGRITFLTFIPLLPCSFLIFTSFFLPSSHLIYLVSVNISFPLVLYYYSVLSTHHLLCLLSFQFIFSLFSCYSCFFHLPLYLFTWHSQDCTFFQNLPLLLFLFYHHRRIFTHFHNKFKSMLFIGTIYRSAIFYLLYY